MTNEQFDFLARYESYLDTATRSNWARHPGSSALEKMGEIYTSITGVKRRVNAGCQVCNLNLLKDVGRIYFAEKAIRLTERANTIIETAETAQISPSTPKTDSKPKRTYKRKK